IEGILTEMRPWVARMNLFLTGWWSLDIAIMWLAPGRLSWVHDVTYVFLFTVFVFTELFLRPGFVRYLGIAMIISVVFSLLVGAGVRTHPYVPPRPPSQAERRPIG